MSASGNLLEFPVRLFPSQNNTNQLEDTQYLKSTFNRKAIYVRVQGYFKRISSLLCNIFIRIRILCIFIRFAIDFTAKRSTSKSFPTAYRWGGGGKRG